SFSYSSSCALPPLSLHDALPILPQLFKFTAIQTVLLGAGLSLSVELIQLVTRLGMFELDDIIFNTLSVVLGHALLACAERRAGRDRKSTRLNSSHVSISYAVFCL